MSNNPSSPEKQASLIKALSEAAYDAANAPGAMGEYEEYCSEEMAAAAVVAVIEALREAGYVIVPREPTEAMIDAGQGPHGELSQTDPPILKYDCDEVWRAMVGAAGGGEP